MNKYTKLILSVLIFIVLVFSFTACGEKPQAVNVTAQASFDIDTDTHFEIKVSGGTVITVSIADNEVDFDVITDGVKVMAEDMPELRAGNTQGAVMLSDGNVYAFSFNCLKETTIKEPEENLVLEIKIPKTVRPYSLNAYNYLKSDGKDVAEFHSNSADSVIGIEISWNCTLGDTIASVDEVVFEYSTDKDFLSSTMVEQNKTSNKVKLYNLFKDTTYYVKVTATVGKKDISQTASFKTIDIGPRVIYLPGDENGDVLGGFNVRDVGGYSVGESKTLQGMIYRGGQLRTGAVTNELPVALSQEARRILKEDLGIKTEIDLRGKPEAGGFEKSLIDGATLYYCTVNGYGSAFEQTYKASYANVFKLLADKNNYPFYIHCTGGADRTGTVMLILTSMLGMEYTDILNDWEFTTFSRAGVRSSQSGFYKSYFDAYMNGINKFEGDTLTKKTENYLLSIGVTQNEINNIRSIMLNI